MIKQLWGTSPSRVASRKDFRCRQHSKRHRRHCLHPSTCTANRAILRRIPARHPPPPPPTTTTTITPRTSRRTPRPTTTKEEIVAEVNSLCAEKASTTTAISSRHRAVVVLLLVVGLECLRRVESRGRRHQLGFRILTPRGFMYRVGTKKITCCYGGQCKRKLSDKDVGRK